VKNGKRDFWWLLGLEATLFFSLPCWELTAPYAEPATYPLRFVICVLGAATVATLACHIGPALFAARFGGLRHRLAWLLLLWLGFGYLEWLLSVVRTTSLVSAYLPGSMWIFLAAVLIAGLVWAWWKPVVIIALLLGAVNPVWALAITWHGLWVPNPHFGNEPPVQLDWLIVKGMLLSAAPAVVVAWRIGRIESRPKRIWLSGLVGVWLPLVCSVAIASLSVRAGANLYWVPSIGRGFRIALAGITGRLGPGVTIPLLIATLLGPALFSVISLRQMAPPWQGRTRVWLVPVFVGLLVCVVASTYCHPEGMYYDFSSAAHELWAASLVACGAIAGLACVAFRRQS